MNKDKETTISDAERLIPELRFPEFKNDGEWEKKPLENLLQFQTGFPFDSEGFNEEGKGVRLIKNRDLKSNDKIVHYNKPYDEKYIVTNGDVLVGMDGDFTPIKWDKGTALLNQRVGRVLTNKKGDELFFLYFLSIHLKTIEEKTARTTVKHLSHFVVEKIYEPLPNPKEQLKIAFCLSSLDEAIAAHNQKLDLLKNHKKGLMQNLFPQEGETVPKWRFKEFEKEGEWVEEILGNVIKYFKGFAFQSQDYVPKGRRIIRVSDMGFDYIKNEENAIYIDEGNAFQYEKWQLKKDDLIITTVGSKPPMYDSLVGRTIIVESKDENALLNQNAVCLRANAKITQEFLNTLFKKSEYITFIESIIRGNANQGSIALEDLFKYKFLQPKNPKEQQKIASCLSSLNALITAQAEKIEQLKLHKKGLMQGLFPKMND